MLIDEEGKLFGIFDLTMIGAVLLMVGLIILYRIIAPGGLMKNIDNIPKPSAVLERYDVVNYSETIVYDSNLNISLKNSTMITYYYVMK